MDTSEQKILQKSLARFLIDDVFNTITEDDILKVQAPGVWTHKGKPLTEGQIKALKHEAEAFAQSGLWQILKAELLWLALQTGYKKSVTEADQISGKLIEYLTDVIDTKLRRMKEL